MQIDLTIKVKVLYNGIDKYGYSYNTDGSLYSVTEYGTANKIYYYNYDGIGRLVSMQLYEGDTLISYQICSYDEYSRAQTTTEQGGQNRVTDSYTYNNNNGLTTSVSQNYKAGVKSATNTFAYTYDELKRADSITVTHDGTSYSESYVYSDNLKNNGYSSNLVSRKYYTRSQQPEAMYIFGYTYDRVGNIKSATTSTLDTSSVDGNVTYFYDEQNQLVMECNEIAGQTYFYEYDTYGNIRQKKTYNAIGVSSLSDLDYITPISIDTYEYTNNGWYDQLTEYNDAPFLYDNIGNPLTYNNGSAYTFTWQNGRQLAQATVGSTTIGYEYNIDGLRTKKSVQNGETYLYYYSGNKLISMTWDNGAKSLNFLYNGAAPYSVVYRFSENSVNYSSSYYYITNLQGDVVAIMNAEHGIVAEYVYDAWGNILAITNSNGTDISGNAAHIANLNPIRYRGYFYDTETGFYYLQSRYYDPVIGRFINEDVYTTTGIGFIGCNMYAYCNNNPVMYVDYYGNKVYPAGFVGPLRPEDSYETEIKEKTIEENEPFALYDNWRINSNTSFHEQAIVVDTYGPEIDIENGDFTIGGVEFDFYKAGWEEGDFSASVFDIGHVEAEVKYDNGELEAGVMASLWSPGFEFEAFGHKVEIGAEVGSIGAGFHNNNSGMGFKLSYLFGISLSISK